MDKPDHEIVCGALSAALRLLSIAEELIARGDAPDYWPSEIEGVRSYVREIERLTPKEFWQELPCAMDKLLLFNLWSCRMLAAHQKPANDNGQVFEA